MKNIIVIMLLAGLTACGYGNSYLSGPMGPQGEKGDPGVSGEAGVNGHSVVFSTLDVATSCSNGGRTILIGLDLNDNFVLDAADGNIQSNEICNGTNGSNGADGVDGQDGSNGADGQNGSDGSNGHDGVSPTLSPFMPTELVSFCGDVTRTWSEVGFRLANGMIVASFSENENGKNTRWTVIIPGTYRTTDGYSCNFTVTNTGQILR